LWFTTYAEEGWGYVVFFFRKVSSGESEPHELKAELDRWNLFEEYEDRFFTIFKKRR